MRACDRALFGLYFFQDFPNSMAPAFGSDDNTRIEDYSDAGEFHYQKRLAG